MANRTYPNQASHAIVPKSFFNKMVSKHSPKRCLKKASRTAASNNGFKCWSANPFKSDLAKRFQKMYWERLQGRFLIDTISTTNRSALIVHMRSQDVNQRRWRFYFLGAAGTDRNRSFAFYKYGSHRNILAYAMQELWDDAGSRGEASPWEMPERELLTI